MMTALLSLFLSAGCGGGAGVSAGERGDARAQKTLLFNTEAISPSLAGLSGGGLGVSGTLAGLSGGGLGVSGTLAGLSGEGLVVSGTLAGLSGKGARVEVAGSIIYGQRLTSTLTAGFYAKLG